MRKYKRVLLSGGGGTKLYPLAFALLQALNEYLTPAHNANNTAKCTVTLRRRKSKDKMLFQFVYTLRGIYCV